MRNRAANNPLAAGGVFDYGSPSPSEGVDPAGFPSNQPFWEVDRIDTVGAMAVFQVSRPLRYQLFTPELQWQSSGQRRISQGGTNHRESSGPPLSTTAASSPSTAPPAPAGCTSAQPATCCRHPPRTFQCADGPTQLYVDLPTKGT